MDLVRSMRVFVAVAESGGFASAAKRLRMSPPAVTRDVAALEEHLGCKLLLRSTRHVRLSSAGSRYILDARRILSELEDAEQSLIGAHRELSGRIVLTAPVMFGRLHVAAHILGFARQYPAVAFDIRLLDRVIDMMEEGIDVAVRIAHLADSTATAIRVGSVRRVLCAAPGYLLEHGTPQSLADLRRLDAIGLSASALGWSFSKSGRSRIVQKTPRFITNSIETAIDAAKSGLGLVQLLSYQATSTLKSGELQAVLEEYEPDPVPVHILHLEGRAASRRVRAFIDHLIEHLRRDPVLKDGDRSRLRRPASGIH